MTPNLSTPPETYHPRLESLWRSGNALLQSATYPVADVADYGRPPSGGVAALSCSAPSRSGVSVIRLRSLAQKLNVSKMPIYAPDARSTIPYRTRLTPSE